MYLGRAWERRSPAHVFHRTGPLPLDVGVEVLAHLGLLLDVPLVGLLDEAAHVELGGVFHLLGHQFLLGIDLLLLIVCEMAVILL